jgi:hypothetical protein
MAQVVVGAGDHVEAGIVELIERAVRPRERRTPLLSPVPQALVTDRLVLDRDLATAPCSEPGQSAPRGVSPRRARHRERLPRSAGWQVDRVVVTDDDAVL